MSDGTSVVTRERFVQGFTYQEYIAQMESNKERFEWNYRQFQLADEDREFFSKTNETRGPLKVVALAEDWCPDVHRGLPIMAKIAEVAGMELRVFPRDRNRDIMNEYLNQGTFMSIPVFAFFDQDFTPLCHWIERPAAATTFVKNISEELEKGDLSEEEKRAERARRQAAVWDSWRQETVRELRSLLSAVVG